MSWSVQSPKGAGLAAAHGAIAAAHDHLPPEIETHLQDALASLEKRYGPDTRVDMTAHGHFFDGTPESHDVTTVTIEIRKHQETAAHQVDEQGTAEDTHAEGN